MANQGWRDSRFGQFADPNFGASLYNQNDQGVLPDTGGGSSSASSDDNNGVVTGTPDPFSGMPSNMIPGLMPPRDGGYFSPHTDTNPGGGPASDTGWRPEGHYGPGLIGPGPYLAEGGMVGDEDQDSGAASPAGSILDPMQILEWGRKKFGLPSKFFGTPKQKTQGDDVAEAVADEGGSAKQLPDDLRAFNLNNALGQMGPDQSIQWGDTEVPGQQKDAMYLEDGGMIPDDTQTGDEDTQTGASQSQGQSSAMSYLSGADGVPPEVAAAMEQQVDPQGQMDPSERKMKAIQNAGSPEKAHGLMQHYRSKFNAYSAFAQAAMQGAGGRPPNGMAAADALNKAYENVPDGNSMHFTPVRGGMKVAMRKIIPSRPAPSGGEKPPSETPPGPPVRQFEDGGPVEEENYDDTYVSPAADQELRDAPAPGKAPHEYLRDVFLSVPILRDWLKNDGQFDSMVEKQGDTLPAQTYQSPAADQELRDEPAGEPAQPAQPVMGPGGAPARDPNQRMLQQKPDFQAPLRKSADWPTPDVPEIVKQAAQEPTLKDVLHEIDLAFPFVGQGQQKALARAQAIQEWQKNNSGIRREQLRNDALAGRTHEIVQGRENVARIQAENKLAAADFVQQHRNDRQLRDIAAKLQMAQQQNDIRAYQAQMGALRTYLGTAMTNQPGLVKDPKRLNDLADQVMGHFGVNPQVPQQAPAQPPAQAQPPGGPPAPPRPAAPQVTNIPPRPQVPSGQPLKLVNGKWYTRGPNGEAVPVQ